MGGFEQWRNFLLVLFPLCFHEKIERGTEFCLCLVDLMMVLAPGVLAKKDCTFETSQLLQRIEKTVAHYQNNEEDEERPLIKTATVVMIDTVHRVPKNKSAKQRVRDGDEIQFMNQEAYEKMMALHTPEDKLFISNNYQPYFYPLEGRMVWRSVNLKLQLYRLVTHHLLSTPVAQEKVLIIDDGLAYTTEDFARVRQQMIDEHQFGERTAFEQECLVHQLLTNSKNFVTRFMVWHDGTFRRFDSTGTGEADIKIQHYIRRDNGAKKFLVVNQDTDVIFILLLHMVTLLKEDETDDEIEVWIDTRSPTDKADNRAYRFINVKKLYYSIQRLFREEYPGVLHPVETFCFIVFSLETDFTRKFPKCLQVYESVVWNLFSELHSTKKSYIKFSTKAGIQRQERQTMYARELYGLLNRGVAYDHVKKFFILDHERVKDFYFLLCQLRVMRVRKDLCLSSGAYDQCKETPLIDTSELLIYAREVCEKLEQFKKYEASQEKVMGQFLQSKKRKLSTEEQQGGEKKFKKSSRQRTIIHLEVSHPDEEQEDEIQAADQTTASKKASYLLDDKAYLRQNEKMLRLHAKKEIQSDFYGVPTENEMLARIYRIEWYLSYCRDGWRAPLDFTQMARQDSALSVWGWRERKIDASVDALNSSYYSTRYAPRESPAMFVVSEIVETDEVYHRRYTQLPPLQID